MIARLAGTIKERNLWLSPACLCCGSEFRAQGCLIEAYRCIAVLVATSGMGWSLWRGRSINRAAIWAGGRKAFERV